MQHTEVAQRSTQSKGPKLLFAVAVLATLVGLFYAVENWRGRRAWERCRNELLARGERLELKTFIPPPVSDEDNFLKVPPLETWFRRNPADTNALALMPRLPAGLKSIPPTLFDLKDWNHFAAAFEPGAEFLSDQTQPPAAALLKWFERYHDGLQALYTAASRPGARFDADYTRGVETEVPYFVGARRVAQAMATHAEANLLVGKPAEAMRDLTVLDRMVMTFRSSPTLVGAMIGVAIGGLYDDVVQQGLAEHLWQPAQMVEIQEQVLRFNFITDYNQAMRGGEMANLLQFLQNASRARLLDVLGVNKGYWDKLADALYYRLAPRGWIDQNMARYARLISDSLQAVDVNAGRVYPAKCPQLEQRIYNEVRRTPYHYVLACAVPNMIKALQRVTERQAQADLTALACALERFRAAEGGYPAKLEELVPKYISKLPQDHVSGQPLRYRTEGNHRCTVYAVGWDQVDNGGDSGDWTWTSPTS